MLDKIYFKYVATKIDFCLNLKFRYLKLKFDNQLEYAVCRGFISQLLSNSYFRKIKKIRL